MPQYTGMKSVLDAALGKYASEGFTLVEPDDHLTELYFKDLLVTVFNQHTLTIPRLHAECQEYLDELSLNTYRVIL